MTAAGPRALLPSATAPCVYHARHEIAHPPTSRESTRRTALPDARLPLDACDLDRAAPSCR